MSGLFIIDDDIHINNHPVFTINYDLDFSKFSLEQLCLNIDECFKNALQQPLENLNSTYILLINLNNLKNNDLSISKIKGVIGYMMKSYPNLIEKCIIYNYSLVWKIFISLILTIVDNETKKKICFKKELHI